MAQKHLPRGQWQKVEEELSADITAGNYVRGTQLPSEAELMIRFSVGRHSVRKALAQLEERGLIYTEQGKGSFIRDARIDYRLSERTRFSQNLLEQGREPFGRPVREKEMPATALISEALSLPLGEPVYMITRISYADETPVSFGSSWFPVRRFPGFDAARREGRTITSILNDYGVSDYIRLRTDIITRLPTREEARYLEQPDTQPVLLQMKVDVDMKGVPISYSESVWAGDRVQMSVDNTAQLLKILAGSQ